MIPSTINLAGYRPPAGGGGGGGGGGGAGPTASITDRLVAKSSNTGATVTATYKIDNDGNVYNHNNTLLEAWLDTGTNADFEVKAVLSGDPLASGTLNTYQATTADRSWSLTAAPGEAWESVLTVSIRDATSHVVLTTATITIDASSL